MKFKPLPFVHPMPQRFAWPNRQATMALARRPGAMAVHTIAPVPVTEPPAGRPMSGPITGKTKRPLGQILLDDGVITPEDLIRALALQARQQVRFGVILQTHGMASAAQVMAGLSRQWNARIIDPLADPPDARLIEGIAPETCLRHALLPWRSIGGATVIATARPDRFEALRPMLEARFGTVIMALASENSLQDAVLHSRGPALGRRAETRLPEEESCRGAQIGAARAGLITGTLSLAGLAIAFPRAAFILLLGWALLTMFIGTGLKMAAALATHRARASARRHEAESWSGARPTIARLPVVSILVPLYGECDIAPRLIRRLGRISYPRELLDVVLIAEADDMQTRAALANTTLPRWMRQISVPAGTLKTKPRALNFALDFCRGSVIGVYDAEDAPAPDQIHRVVRRFHETGLDVACLQGVLDYYNPHTNWLSRCFTIEYATWFRIVLPGLQRLGLVLPLGGTTLFFRRKTLEELGGWDAHNVTEDADLGIRLARHGYRTEILETVTAEEANCHILPWIRQRSRWLKGYAITYAVHMRSPRRLLADLGWWRFTGVQILFLGTLSQFVLAPFLWSFWLPVLGLGHPLAGLVPTGFFVAVGLLFLLSEVFNISVAMIATSGRRHRGLRPWTFTLHLYYPLAAMAAYKALWETVTRPFYWDKTVHGKFDGDEAPPEALALRCGPGRAA